MKTEEIAFHAKQKNTFYGQRRNLLSVFFAVNIISLQYIIIINSNISEMHIVVSGINEIQLFIYPNFFFLQKKKIPLASE